MALGCKDLSANAGDVIDTGSIPELRRSPEKKIPWQPTPVLLRKRILMERGAVAIVHGAALYWTLLRQLSMHVHTGIKIVRLVQGI